MTSHNVDEAIDKVLEELKHKSSLEIFELFYEKSETFRNMCKELIGKKEGE